MAAVLAGAAASARGECRLLGGLTTRRHAARCYAVSRAAGLVGDRAVVAGRVVVAAAARGCCGQSRSVSAPQSGSARSTGSSDRRDGHRRADLRDGPLIVAHGRAWHQRRAARRRVQSAGDRPCALVGVAGRRSGNRRRRRTAGVPRPELVSRCSPRCSSAFAHGRAREAASNVDLVLGDARAADQPRRQPSSPWCPPKRPPAPRARVWPTLALLGLPRRLRRTIVCSPSRRRKAASAIVAVLASLYPVGGRDPRASGCPGERLAR